MSRSEECQRTVERWHYLVGEAQITELSALREGVSGRPLEGRDVDVCRAC